MFAWHRQAQLKAIAETLGSVQKQLENPVTEADVETSYETARQYLRAVLERAAPAMADLALSLREQQIENIASRFADNNEDFRKERLRGDVAQRQEARYRRTLKSAQHWFGSFTAEQQREMRMLSDARPLDEDAELAERIARQEALLGLLRAIRADKPTRDTAIAMVREHVHRMLQPSADETRRDYFARYRSATVHMVANIINNATPQQRQHCIAEVQAWIDDVEKQSPPTRTTALKSPLIPRLD